MFRSIATLALCLATATAQAALHGRVPSTPGGTDYQAYYDDVLNITWIADANYAETSGYNDDGLMTSAEAQDWIGSLNAANHLGLSNWRLPAVLDTGTSGCDFAYSGTDCGWNVNLAGSEMAHLFYSSLGNDGYYDTNTDPTGCSLDAPLCLTNTGPFANLQPFHYWSDTSYAPSPSDAWYFHFGDGLQLMGYKDDPRHPWAVRNGDIEAPDADADGVPDAADNCVSVANAAQCDSDGDGYGNHCDGDLNNNGATNAFDTPFFRQQLGQPSVAPTYNIADLNCNGSVNAFDTPIFRSLLGSPPGPSGLVP